MVYIIVLVIFLVIAFVARYTKAGEGFPKKNSFIEQLIFDAAAFVQRWFCGKRIGQDSAFREVERIKLFLVVFMAGDIVAMLLWISGDGAALVVDGAYISRKKAGEGTIQVQLTAKGGEDKEADISVTVAESLYEDARLQLLYEEMLAELEGVVLGENASWDCVTKDLLFVEELPGYPFALTWSSDNYLFLSSVGKVATWREVADLEKQTALVTVTLRAEYHDFAREHIFFAKICPMEGEKSFSDEVAYALEKAERDSAGEDKLRLPTTLGGDTLSWSEKKDDSGKMVFLLGTAGAVAVSLFSEKDLQKEREKRSAKMEAEYPTLISKLTLYLGAGLNLKNAFVQVAEEGSNPVYQEMKITCREMESGISEGEAYERFGKRINKKQYIRLTMLLIQNLKKGNAELLAQLKQEAYLALEEKNMAMKKIGEETGTKLLLPMMLMLAMVMVLIMVPAFLAI